MAAFHLLQVLFGWRFLLPLTLHSCPLFFDSQLSKPLYSASFLEKVFPHPENIWFFSHHSPNPSTSRLFLHNLSPLPICHRFFSFCLQVFVETFLTQVGRICFNSFINHHRSQLPIAECLFAALIVTTVAEHLPRSVRKTSLPLLHAPYSLLLTHNPVFLQIPPESLSFSDF